MKKVVLSAADQAEQAAKCRLVADVHSWGAGVLREQVWAEPIRQLARRYGVSDVALAKR